MLAKRALPQPHVTPPPEPREFVRGFILCTGKPRKVKARWKILPRLPSKTV
jgi:hypothetical protein